LSISTCAAHLGCIGFLCISLKVGGCLWGKKGLGEEKLELELKRVSRGIKVTIGT